MTEKQRDEALNLPLVRQVIDLFDARLVDLRPAEGYEATGHRAPREKPSGGDEGGAEGDEDQSGDEQDA